MLTKILLKFNNKPFDSYRYFFKLCFKHINRAQRLPFVLNLYLTHIIYYFIFKHKTNNSQLKIKCYTIFTQK